MRLVLSIIGLIVVIFGGLFWLVSLDDQAQDEYLRRHHCVIKQRTQDTVMPVVGGGGGVIYVPGKTTYACDDNVTYVR